ncbi:hypothetical protein HDU76_002676 [Blyttiomyces sp. JEL0837]|nr:hypothetical protein HDU76_002676 [Blyttiomyces sp. JEL0837]
MDQPISPNYPTSPSSSPSQQTQRPISPDHLPPSPQHQHQHQHHHYSLHLNHQIYLTEQAIRVIVETMDKSEDNINLLRTQLLYNRTELQNIHHQIDNIESGQLCQDSLFELLGTPVECDDRVVLDELREYREVLLQGLGRKMVRLRAVEDWMRVELEEFMEMREVLGRRLGKVQREWERLMELRMEERFRWEDGGGESDGEVGGSEEDVRVCDLDEEKVDL